MQTASVEKNNTPYKNNFGFFLNWERINKAHILDIFTKK